MKKTIVIALITFLILAFVVLSMGGGHGFYWPAKLICPYSMIISITNNQIGILAIVLAVIQNPFYGFVISKKNQIDFSNSWNSYCFSNYLPELTDRNI